MVTDCSLTGQSGVMESTPKFVICIVLRKLYCRRAVFLINRYNVCIMAYGQTGSGKTHTMLGSHDLDMEIDSESLNKDEGIIPRSAKELFRLVPRL